MADPESMTLTQVRDALATIGIAVDETFVSLGLCDDVLTIERLERSPAGMNCKRSGGGVRTLTTEIPVVADPPPAG